MNSAAAIVAFSQNGIIGRNNQLPWRLRGDLVRFRKITMGNALIMGRKTYESIGRPLPGRLTIVVTRQPDLNISDVVTANSIEQAFHRVPQNMRAFVAGGAEIFRQAAPWIDEWFITKILADIDGDTYLDDPTKNNDFELLEEHAYPSDNENEWPTVFQRWKRSV